MMCFMTTSRHEQKFTRDLSYREIRFRENTLVYKMSVSNKVNKQIVRITTHGCNLDTVTLASRVKISLYDFPQWNYIFQLLS